jgi:hypothetical protein
MEKIATISVIIVGRSKLKFIPFLFSKKIIEMPSFTRLRLLWSDVQQKHSPALPYLFKKVNLKDSMKELLKSKKALI